ncbi:hypothetical protein BLS_006172 [Venturia inaequalis]|uniref:Yos1-like protein n=1 Tax=Venturia inaequalis TaxID=5025 RepID=A0A8H3UEJ2_VENIN|nr:hypothetical protein BLS_006172 [Venturia inaequalis]
MALLFPSFGLGSLFYVGVLLVNAIAVLSEDRFLARIGWSPNSVTSEPSFGAPQDGNSINSADRHQYAGDNISVYTGLSVKNKTRKDIMTDEGMAPRKSAERWIEGQIRCLSHFGILDC